LDLAVLNRFRKGFRVNICNQVVTILVHLIGVPILLHAWGTQLYGEWLILSAIPTYLTLTDLGLSQSAANDMTARIASGDVSGAIIVFHSLISFIFVAIAAMFILSSSLIFCLPLENWFHFKQMTILEVRWTFFFLSAAIFIQIPDGISDAGFRAAGEYALHMALYSITRLISISAVWITALIGGGPVIAAASFFGVHLFATPGIALLLSHRHKYFRFGLKFSDRKELNRLLKPAFANLAITLAEGINIQGMVLAIGAVLGPLSVVTFSTLRTLTRLPLQLIYSINDASEPEFASAYGARNNLLYNSLFLQMLSAGFWLALIAALGMAFFGKSILIFWTNGKVTIDPILFTWLLVSSTASVLWRGGLAILKAANKHLNAALLFAINSAAIVGLGFFLMSWTRDISNAGLALLFMDIMMTIFTLRSASHLIGIQARSILFALNPLLAFRLVCKKGGGPHNLDNVLSSRSVPERRI